MPPEIDRIEPARLGQFLPNCAILRDLCAMLHNNRLANP